jgi:4-hydroxy-tetrahydrodipicolinate synthase
MFQGTLTALVTPFSGDKVDFEALGRQIDAQLDAGIDGLVPVGTTGESPTLSFSEHEQVIEYTVRRVNGRVPVVAGAGANSTAEALHLHRFARAAGATAALSVTPYYNRPSQEGLYAHFMTLADRVELPTVLYNVPSRTGVNLLPETVARLSRHPQIVAIKEACGSIDQCCRILELCELPILSGDDAMTVPLMAIGGRGVVSVVSNLLPARVVQMTRAALLGDFRLAATLHRELYPVARCMFLEPSPGCIKYAMSLRGMDSGELRLPMVAPSERTKAEIRDLLASRFPQ